MAVNPKLQLKEASVLYSKSSRYFAYYADLLFESGKIRKAEKILEKNMPNYKDYLTAYLTYAKILMSREKLDEATEILKNAIEIDTRCVTAYKLLGDLEIMKSNSHDHLQYYSEVMRYDPCNSDIKNMLHILEKKFDIKSEDDILSRYYSDKDISLPKLPNSERDIVFSEEDEKSFKKLGKALDRTDKEKTDSIFEDIETKIENLKETNESIIIEENKDKIDDQSIESKNLKNKNDISNEDIEGKNNTDKKESINSKVSVFSSMKDINLELDKKEKESTTPSINKNNTDTNSQNKVPKDINENENNENNEIKIETVSKVVDYFKQSFDIEDKKTDNNNNNMDKTYNDFFQSSQLDNKEFKEKDNELELHSSKLTDYEDKKIKIDGQDKKHVVIPKRDDSFIDNFFKSQIETSKNDINLPPVDEKSKNSSEINISSKQGSESRVDFNELKETIQQEQEQNNDTQVSEELREETLQEFYDNKISFNHLPIESEFNSEMNNINLSDSEKENINDKNIKKNESKRFILHGSKELEDIDLIEEDRNENFNGSSNIDNSTLMKTTKDIEIEEKIKNLENKTNTNIKNDDSTNNFSSKQQNQKKDITSKIDTNTEINSNIKKKKETELSFNENKILRAYDEIDLLEEERVYKQAGNLSIPEENNESEDNNSFENDSNNSTGILIDDDVNFKKIVVDKVIGDTDTPKSEKKISIVTPTLGEIYSSQGEFQKSKEVYQKLVQKDPDNLEHRVNLIKAEFNITKARITVELDYYKNLLRSHPENEKYKTRYKNFVIELEKVKKDTEHKIVSLKN